jgi:8-oxo-dGTP diphosphatase
MVGFTDVGGLGAFGVDAVSRPLPGGGEAAFETRSTRIGRMVGERWLLKEKEFKRIYSKVPRLTVEVIVRDEHGAIYLTQRSAGPCKGLWHLPGGTVQYGESLLHAVQRVALRELSIDVQHANNCGYIEYPSHYEKGLDCPVGLVFEATGYSGDPMVNTEASSGAWFTKLPDDAHPDQDKFLVNNGYLAVKS